MAPVEACSRRSGVLGRPVSVGLHELPVGGRPRGQSQRVPAPDSGTTAARTSPRLQRPGVSLAAVRRTLALQLATLALAGAAQAQSLWAGRGDGDGISVEVYKPLFKGDVACSTGNCGQPLPASVIFLGVRKTLWEERVALVADLPIAHARVAHYQFRYEFVEADSGGYPVVRVTSSETIGTEIANPYLGVEFPGTWTQEVGVRIEHGSLNHERIIGFASEVERTAAFASKTNTVHYGVAYRPRREDGSTWRGRFALLVPIAHEVTYLLSYRGMYERGYGSYRLSVGLAGIVSVDPRDMTSFNGRMVNQLEAVAEGSWGVWRPALHVRRWLDADLRDVVPLVVGLRVEWRPRYR